MQMLGEEDLYQIFDSKSKKIIGELYLKYLGDEKKGIKMIGRIPDFWIKTPGGISGPYLCKENQFYQISDIDILKSKIWLQVMRSHSLVS
jgi:hypothetical protein